MEYTLNKVPEEFIVLGSDAILAPEVVPLILIELLGPQSHSQALSVPLRAASLPAALAPTKDRIQTNPAWLRSCTPSLHGTDQQA